MSASDSGDSGEYLELALHSVAVAGRVDDGYQVLLQTTRGEIPGILRAREGGESAVIFAGGASGGFREPASGLFTRLARDLLTLGVSSLHLAYRDPDRFDECVLDILAGGSFLGGIGAERLVLIGHSMGGAVAIKAGQFGSRIVAVAALSSQLHGTDQVASLAPRPLLLVHGLEDQVLEATASELIYERARQPKQLVIYPEADHSLAQCAGELQTLLLDWCLQQAG